MASSGSAIFRSIDRASPIITVAICRAGSTRGASGSASIGMVDAAERLVRRMCAVPRRVPAGRGSLYGGVFRLTEGRF